MLQATEEEQIWLLPASEKGNEKARKRGGGWGGVAPGRSP